jgi:hypothetical protein
MMNMDHNGKFAGFVVWLFHFGVSAISSYYPDRSMLVVVKYEVFMVDLCLSEFGHSMTASREWG